eukprot:7848851-Ditylum_brightwellii.AAC.1
MLAVKTSLKVLVLLLLLALLQYPYWELTSIGEGIQVWDWVPALSPSADGAALLSPPPPLLVPVPKYILGSYETHLGVRAIFPVCPIHPPHRFGV